MDIFILFGILLLIFIILLACNYILPTYITTKIFGVNFKETRWYYYAIIIFLSGCIGSVFLFSYSLFLGEGIYTPSLVGAIIFFGLYVLIAKKLNKKAPLSVGVTIISSFIAVLLSIIFVLLLHFITYALITPINVAGMSMSPSFYDREFLIAKKIYGKPELGDVVAFRPDSANKKILFLNRVIATPGDELKIENGEVYRKKKGDNEFILVNEPYLAEENIGKTFVSGKKEALYTLGENEYFLMGDNRQQSTDSRECYGDCSTFPHYVMEEQIVGKVVFDFGYFNFKKFEFIHPNLGIDTSPRYFAVP